MSAGEMLFSYGPGTYQSGGKTFSGEIILGEFRLFLRNAQGDLAATYIPLERISQIRRTFSGVTVKVQLSSVEGYEAVWTGPRRSLDDLVRDIVRRRNLRRRFLTGTWYDPDMA